MPDWLAIRAALAEQGVAVDPAVTPAPVGGGDISAAWSIDGSRGRIFLKTGPAGAGDMFDAEADGLREIEATATVRVPRVLGHGSAGNDAFLALEWIDFSAATDVTQRLLGERLAAMHRATSHQHGWHRDNTIGATPQINTPSGDWCEFYRERRLGYQLELAATNGYTGRLPQLGRALLERLEEFFVDHEPAPSLLHGDLWGGNQAACGDEPVIFDPAVYHGDRETDLAMTRLFGGFRRDFYEAYERAWPLPPGHERRNGVYQLYHVLNHLNLFGRGYLGRAESLLDGALASLDRKL